MTPKTDASTPHLLKKSKFKIPDACPGGNYSVHTPRFISNLANFNSIKRRLCGIKALHNIIYSIIRLQCSMKYVTRVCAAARDEDEFPIKMLLMFSAVYSRLVDTKEKKSCEYRSIIENSNHILCEFLCVFLYNIYIYIFIVYTLSRTIFDLSVKIDT